MGGAQPLKNSSESRRDWLSCGHRLVTWAAARDAIADRPDHLFAERVRSDDAERNKSAAHPGDGRHVILRSCGGLCGGSPSPTSDAVPSRRLS